MGCLCSIRGREEQGETRTFEVPNAVRNKHANAIKTSHYTWWNFVPVNLFEQFHRLSNVFFLFCSILQAIKIISPLNPVMGFLSLSNMMLISMIKTGYEDLMRHLADKRLNNRETKIQMEEATETVKWEEVNPGDVLALSNDDEFPADCIIISTESNDNRCRIETAALDGETSLKFRSPIDVDVADLKRGFEVEVSNPVANLSAFNGNLRVGDRVIPLSRNNFVPRGCFLRKTIGVKALAVYTGKETKVMLNAMKPRFKYTEIDRFLARVVIILVMVLFSFAVTFDVCSYFWTQQNLHQRHLMLDQQSKIYYVYNGLSWFLIINSLIPLCVYSSLDIVRFFISLTITFDKEMLEGTKHTYCRNSDLCSTIGRITHVFSDKTGTMTKNKMTFRAVGFEDELVGCDDDMKTEDNCDSERMVSMPKESIDYVIRSARSNPVIRDLLLNICLCHSAVTTVNTHLYSLTEIQSHFPGFEFTYDLPPPEVVARFPYTVSYQASSPDEIAFLHFARECGYILYKVAGNNVHIIIDGVERVFHRPLMFSFTSSRKRQSVLAEVDGTYKLFAKGAEVAILARSTSYGAGLSANIQKVAKHGLRTLVFAQKECEKPDEIIASYNEMALDISHGEQRILEFAEQVEQGFEMIAVTGVLDELQDQICETISLLKRANIKIWMLTGDNIDTSMNIATNAGLIEPSQVCITIDRLEDLDKCDGTDISNAVIAIEGHNFDEFFEDPRFIEVAEQASSVICSRLEPGQKGNAVRRFKQKAKKAQILAMGDGANDVDMIRVADVGIGVEGCEGSDAVLSSDFSIPSFRHIARLLLVHGRWGANRTALLVILTFYKNTMLGGTEMLYGIFNGFSASSAFDSGFLSVYNLLLAIPQLFFVCVMEQDVDANFALLVPQAYTDLQKNGGLGLVPFIAMYIHALVHMIMLFFFSFFESNTVCLDSYGSTFDFPIYTQVNGWTVLILFTVECLLKFTSMTIIHISLYIGCVVIYAIVALFYSNGDKQFFNILGIIATAPRIWFTIPFAVGGCIIVDMIAIYIWPFCFPTVASLASRFHHN